MELREVPADYAKGHIQMISEDKRKKEERKKKGRKEGKKEKRLFQPFLNPVEC